MNDRGIIYIPSNGIWTKRDHIRYGLDFFKRKKVNPLVITTSYQEKNYDYLVQKDQKDEINDFCDFIGKDPLLVQGAGGNVQGTSPDAAVDSPSDSPDTDSEPEKGPDEPIVG